MSTGYKHKSGTKYPYQSKPKPLASKGKKGHSGHRRRKSTSGAGKKLTWILAVLAVVLLCFGLYNAYFRYIRFSGPNGRIPEVEYSSFVLDLSHHNGTDIQWDSLKVYIGADGRCVKQAEKAVKTAPIEAVFLKATEGTTLTDSNFKQHWNKAKVSGFNRGAYHFFNPRKEGISQAEYFCSVVGNLGLSDLPPVLDIETEPSTISAAELNRNLKAWLDYVEDFYNKKPIVYTYEDYAAKILSSEILDNYPIWIAHYGTDSPDFSNWYIWQFTDSAVIPGIPGPVDLSLLR